MIGWIKRVLLQQTDDEIEIRRMAEQRKKLDKRVNDLEKLTMNGDMGWFVDRIKEDPTCAIKILRECNAGHDVPDD